MIPRTLQRSLRRMPYRPEACKTCACRCGTQFQTQPFSTSRRGQARQVRSAPTTFKRKATILSPAEARHLAELKSEKDRTMSNHRRAQIDGAYEKGEFSVTADQVAVFLEHFAELYEDQKLRLGAAAPPGFIAIVEHHKLSEQDLLFLSLMLVQNKGSEGDRYWGRLLLDTMSAAGYAEATLRIVNNALVSAATKPGVLRQAAIAVERGRLQAIARKEEHIRAMVLEGKICYFLGDSDTAIKWWWKAVEGSIARSQDIMARVMSGKKVPVDIASVDLSDLSTPWIELIEAHFDRSLTKGKNEWEQVEKAINIGVAQDDPTAHYYAATYYKKRHEDGSHSPTSDWLYYMTKAASSGVPKAAYELGVYYAESGWKYLEDEPPDSVKPTPFDTYPGPNALESIWQTVARQFRRKDERPTQDIGKLFHTAAWPSTPAERMALAVSWLGLASNYTYAPAHLYRAKLFMQKTLWAGAQAPPEALDLDPKRYLYNNKEEELEAQFTGSAKAYEVSEDAQDPPNPFYSLEKAKEEIRWVMYARFAAVGRQRLIDNHIKKRGTKDVVWEDVEGQVNQVISLFVDNTDVFDMWQGESLAMYKEAAAICDHMGWNIYDGKNALVYKAGVGNTHGL